MRICHACQRELEPASLSAGRCAHCGATIRNLSQRTFEDKRKPLGPQKPSDSEQTIDSINLDPSIDLPGSGASRPDATIELAHSDTAGDVGTPLTGKVSQTPSDPERKSPTVGDQGDLTIELPPTGIIPSTDPPKKPGRRSTHTMEADRTIDLDTSSADARKLESQWKGTFDRGSRQGQTIRQKETVSGFRSSLPVKSRYVRERRAAGAPPPASPAEVPDYELLDILGEGGMGVVYSAHQSSIARTVAVKMLKPQAKVREEQRDKFISEAVVTGELDHPNIVPIYDLGANEQGALFYSMKKVKGTPWDKVINEKQLDENLDILLRVADAVAFAHDRGVIHRDLKPENVMLGDYGEVLVMDWGLARISPEFVHKDAVFQVDSLGGTPAYMAPEMARGPIEAINRTSDIYLLGAILYEIIGGQPPHSGKDVMQCLMAASQNRIDAIRYDGELKDLAFKAMATRPEDRYATVKEFQEAVRLYQSHSESLVLTAHAGQNLRKAREANDYQLFARALYGFQESLTLWDANQRAKVLLVETQRDYAKCALGKGDLDLAASLLDKTQPEHQALQVQIDAARRERDARARRLRMAKLAVAGLIAAIIATVTIAYFQVSKARDAAVVARDEAVVAQEQEAVAKTEAVKQRDAAEEAKKLETQAKTEALQAEAAAKAAQKEEEKQRLEAERQEQLAVAAKAAEEYEAYVARIGLAASKINDNAYDYAQQLLAMGDPTMRNWEWGRLAHLCRLSAGSYEAPGQIDAVSYSPDGSWFITGDRSGQIVARDAHTGELRFQVHPGGSIYALAWSPDGRQIAVGSSDPTIRILDAANGQTTKELNGHKEGVLSVRFSPTDGRQLLSGSLDNTARLWDVVKAEMIQELQGHNWWVWAADFSPDATRIVTAGQDGKAILWKKQGTGSGEQGANREIRNSSPSSQPPAPRYSQGIEFIGHEGPVFTARFSPDGKLIATGGYDKMVMVWNPDEVKPVDYEAILQNKDEEKPNYLRLAGHDGPVHSVSFSPNGKLVLSGGEDNAVRLWDVDTGEQVKSLRGHSREVRACTFSPDGQQVLSGAHDKLAMLWNVEGYQEVRVLRATVFSGHLDAVLSARYSKDGKEIVTASRDRTASLWDAQTGKRIRQFEEGHEFLASHAAFYPDRMRLVTGAGDNSARIWDLARGTQIAALAPTGRIGAVAVSPDGAILVTGASGNDVQIWDANSYQLLTTLTGHTDEVSAIAFAPAGDRMATGDERGHIRLWRKGGQSANWTFERQLDGHNGSISDLKFAPNGAQLVSASGDRTCSQWDLATGREDRQRVLKHPDYVSSLDLSADGTLAVTTCDDGSARLWRLGDARELASVKSPKGKFSTISFAPDARTAIVTAPEAKQVLRWKLPTSTAGQPASATAPNSSPLEVVLDFDQLGGLVWSAMYAPDGNDVLTIGGNDAQLWNLESRRPIARLSPHGAVASADVSPDGRLVATGSWDHSAKIWDHDTGRAIRKLDGAHDGYINTVEFSPDSRELLTASDDGTARLWEIETGKATGTMFGKPAGPHIMSATYSPDATRVLTTSADAKARVWNRATGQLSIPEFAGHTKPVLCGRFSPHGERAITGGDDNIAIIWDATSGQMLRKLEGHTAAVTSVAFSPDGNRVLTGSRDNSAKLWDANTGKEILSLPGHTQEVTAVSFSPDGRNVLTSSRDGKAIIWLADDWHTDAPTRTAQQKNRMPEVEARPSSQQHTAVPRHLGVR